MGTSTLHHPSFQWRMRLFVSSRFQDLRHKDSRSWLCLAPIMIINKSRSGTRLLFIFPKVSGLVSSQNNTIYKVLACFPLGLKTNGTRLSVLARSGSRFDYQKVSFSDSSNFYFLCVNHTSSIVQSSPFEPYSRGQTLTLKKPFLFS